MKFSLPLTLALISFVSPASMAMELPQHCSEKLISEEACKFSEDLSLEKLTKAVTTLFNSSVPCNVILGTITALYYCYEPIQVNNHVNFKDEGGNTDLHDAVDRLDTKEVETLLDKGTDVVNAKNKKGFTFLHLATLYKLRKELSQLFEKEWQNDINDYYNYEEVMKFLDTLLDENVGIDAKNKEGKTALHLAVAKNNQEIINLLLKKQADPNVIDNKGRTPLHYAAYSGDRNVTALLLKHSKIKVDVQDKQGRTPLHYVAIKDCEETVKALLLLDKGSDFNLQDKDGYTPLHLAAIHGHKEIIRTALEDEINVNLQDKKGASALHYAAQLGNTETVELLLTHDADVNAQTKNGLTPLHLASLNGYVKIIDLLTKNTAIDVTIQDKYGNTPLHYAIQYNDIRENLLSSGVSKPLAPINVKNKKGQTPLDLAESLSKNS